jgi:tetratricopeptide (TPR) repeat protein
MNYQVEDRARLKKLHDQAIALAMQNKWEEAIGANQSILDVSPKDVDALNRLGRALTELGRYREARDAYSRALENDPLNSIAQKNLARLKTVSVEAEQAAARAKVDPRFFIAETGKTGVTHLLRVANREVIAKMAVGDQVSLQPDGRALYAVNTRNERIGQIEPKLAQRLIDLLKGGNRYAAAVMSIDDSGVRVIIRETYQDPRLVGKVSFPTKGEAGGERPYIKGSLLRYDTDDDDDDSDDAFGGDGEAEETEEPAEPSDFEEDQSG